jgi:hypothetical protein
VGLSGVRTGGVTYCCQHRVGISEDIIVPEPQDPESAPPQFGVPALVGDTVGVLTTIDFDDQTVREAREIDDCAADGDLPPELQTV